MTGTTAYFMERTQPDAAVVPESLMRILVIEDERDLLDALAQSLREAGYAVDEASDGRTGLFKAGGADYDAIVLDLMLPGINGWDLLRTLRKTKPTPVLILTARDALTDRVRGLDAGADDYLTKPFELQELQAPRSGPSSAAARGQDEGCD